VNQTIKWNYPQRFVYLWSFITNSINDCSSHINPQTHKKLFLEKSPSAINSKQMTSHFHLNWSKGKGKIAFKFYDTLPLRSFPLWPWARKPLAEGEETQKDINTSRKRRRKAGKQREYCLGAKKCIITAICIRLSKKRMANETTAECASKSNE